MGEILTFDGSGLLARLGAFYMAPLVSPLLPFLSIIHAPRF
jgi:hypothetical protein